MSKKIVSIILALIMCLALVPITALAADDNPSSWAVEQVNRAIAENLVPQSLQSKYSQATTRAEFCALAVALYENVKGTITGRTTFSDTNDINVEKAASIGVVSGVGSNKFDPDAKLTREQAAVMLSRLADAVGKPFEAQAATFADNTRVSSWALTGVGQVQAAGIMGGVGGNTFAPHDPYTREQSIITILRTYDAVKGGGTVEPTDPTNNDNGKVVGMWRCHYATYDAVYIFNEDGTFFSLSMATATGYNLYGSTYNYMSALHGKGNYNVAGNTIEGTNLQRLSIAAFFNEGENSAETEAESEAEVLRIIQTGTRSEVLELLDPKNHLYRQNDYEWGTYENGSKTGTIEFSGTDKIKIHLYGANNDFTRVNE